MLQHQQHGLIHEAHRASTLILGNLDNMTATAICPEATHGILGSDSAAGFPG